MLSIRNSFFYIFFSFVCPARYAEDLAKLMKKTLLVSEVARLANRIERKVLLLKGQTLDGEAFTKLIDDEEDKSADAGGEIRSSTQNSDLKRQNIRRELGVIKTNSERVSMIDELLDAWEEPKIEGEDTVSRRDISVHG